MLQQYQRTGRAWAGRRQGHALQPRPCSRPRRAGPVHAITGSEASASTGGQKGTGQGQQASKSVLMFGLGYSTLGLGNMLSQQGWHVAATYRRDSLRDALAPRKPGWRLLRFDPCGEVPPGTFSEEVVEALAQCSHVVTSVPPVGLPLYDPALNAQIKAIKAARAKNPGCCQHVAYLSSTGVYGDYEGGWVDESSECRTASARGVLRLEAEKAWAKGLAATGAQLAVFRLGGIYGPGRSLLESILQQQPQQQPHSSQAESTTEQQATGGTGEAAAPGAAGEAETSSSKERRAKQKYTSRCHVMDIGQAVMAWLEQTNAHPAKDISGTAGGAPAVLYFNVVDDEPAPRGEVAAFTREVLQRDGRLAVLQAQAATQPGPTRRASSAESGEEAGSSGSGRRSRRGGSEALEEKRVRNERLKQGLGVSLAYPSYREGMGAIVAGSIAPFEPGDLQALGLVAGP